MYKYVFEFRRPYLKDMEMICSHFKKYHSRSCERTFVNVFLWSKYYGVEFAIIHKTVVFKSENNGMAFSYPAGQKEDVKSAIEILEEYCKERETELSLYNITPDMFEQIEIWFPEKYFIEYNRDIADYVYECEKLTNLSGKKLHGKRNHINKFKQIYENWSYETLNADNIEECFQMALKWRAINEVEKEEEKLAEMGVTLISLYLYKELELVGGALRVNGKIVAFTIGELLCDDTFVVHIEKAFSDIPGAYQMINQQFVEHECQSYTYINREEDMGGEGLRKAKLSYRPIFFVEKGIVKRKGEKQNG